MRFDTAVIDTESATLPPERWVSTCEMFPGGQHATRIMPSAIDGVTGRIRVSANVTAGSTISCARIAMTNGLGLRATTLKSSGEVSSAMPNMISPSTTFRMMSVPGVEVQDDVVDVHAEVLFFEVGRRDAAPRPLSLSKGPRGRGSGPQEVARGAHGAAVGVLVDVVRHALEAEVVVAAGEVGPGSSATRRRKAAARSGRRCDGREVLRDELGLLVAALPADAGRLDHAHHVQPVERRREDVEEQAWARSPRQLRRIARDERVVERVAGGEQHHVVLAARAVAEVHGAAVEPIDVGPHRAGRPGRGG